MGNPPLDMLRDYAYLYTLWTAIQLSKSSNNTVGMKWQKLAPIVNFGIPPKKDGLPFHTQKKTFQWVP